MIKKENYFLIFSLLFVRTVSVSSFGYSKRQQHMWSQEFKKCDGNLQSPIALSTKKSVRLPLPALEMNGYHDFLFQPLSPFIFGGLLNINQEYELEGLHFHWGRKNDRGSEHSLNGVRYPMEMHIIHRNMAYPKMENAMVNVDGLAVLGIFFQLQDNDNENLKPLSQNLPSIRWIDNQISLNTSITLSSLLPNDIDTFYTYRGSLTTPPCSEAVTWIIFSTPVPISFRQMNQFRILSNGEDILADNYRKLQKLGKRKVYLRKLIQNYSSYYNQFDVNVTSLDWYWQ
ncbi:hypothetical protein HCN44_004292 [Aphidius gifuensis]|uniref:Carbonic anhydrase n=1 Tax=Aphidius gifuensis TaxID=684658 RepID=A0A835CVW0_APHGI|nr:hypothetical protein HCN44_004292 [Aphidius gifuensis]